MFVAATVGEYLTFFSVTWNENYSLLTFKVLRSQILEVKFKLSFKNNTITNGIKSIRKIPF
jgi:hypothetical protein